MRYGIQVANIEWQELRDVAQAAEELGFDFLSLPDHIVYEGPEHQTDTHHLAYDPLLQAAVAAEATKKLRVGHLVLCNLFRHPVFTAQAIASIDQLSGGRAFLGIGTGWTETEFKMTGIPYPDIGTRLRMLDEALAIIRSLWTQEHTTFEGDFYRLHDAILWPKPAQKPLPKILLGGGGKGVLRLAAKHADVINLISDVGKKGYIALSSMSQFGNDAFRSKVDFVRAEAVKHGRAPTSVAISHVVFQLMMTDSPAATRSMAEGMAAMFGATPETVARVPLVLLGTPEECAAELRRRQKEWDLSEVIFSFAAIGGVKGLRRIAEQILKHV
jgi:probable F420-dependent oxidoreductase